MARALPEPAVSLRWTIAILVAVAGLLYARQLFLGQTFFLRDHLVYTWTERAILADALRAGRIPEWNPLIGFGTQFAASSANGVTYPPLWLVALLPVRFGMDLVVAGHVLLAGIGAAFLSRRLGADALGATLAGAALMCSGYFASIAPNKIFVGTAWIPWVAWAADRVAASTLDWRSLLRACAAAAAMVAAQLMAGDPASSITAGLVALAIVLARAPRRWVGLLAMGGAAAASLALAAASVLPALALLRHTSRASLSGAEGTSWSLHPLRALELLWPRAFGDPTHSGLNLGQIIAGAGADLEPFWAQSVFVGAVVLALAAIPALSGARGARGLWLGAGLLTVVAMGAHTPLYAAYRAVFLPEQIIRYPEKHLAGVVVLLCALAGAGLAEVKRRRGRSAPWALGSALALLALPVSGLALFRAQLAGALRPAAVLAPGLDVDAALGISLRAGAIALGAAAAASVVVLLYARSGRIAAGAAAVAVIVAHGVLEVWTVVPLAPAEILARRPALLDRAFASGDPDRGAPPPRLLRSPLMDAAIPPAHQPAYRQETLLLDAPGRWGVAAVPGFEGWRSRAFDALWLRAQAMPLRAFQTLFAIEWIALPRKLAPPLFGGSEESVLAQLTLDIAAEGRPEDAFGWTITRRAGARPRAFVAPRWWWVDAAKALDALMERAAARDTARVVLTGDGEPSESGSRDATPLSPCEVTSYRPERVALSCTSPEGGYAVLVEENAPGWSAEVDGVPTPIATADVLLQAVPIGPGAHEVIFSYRTPWLRAGVATSALAWVALGAIALWRRASRGGGSP